MRTTISIEDHLLDQAKQAALERKCSLSELIEESLRLSLMTQARRKQDSAPRPLKTFRGSGVQPGVDLASSAALLEIMEGEHACLLQQASDGR
jgi:hypothetical protein